MPRLNAANNAKSTLVSAINASDTSFEVVNGAVFPAAPFLVTIGEEIIRVNIKNGNIFSNVQRGYENTSASSHISGVVVENRFTAGTLAELGAEIDEKETPSGAQAKVDAHANNTNNPHNVTKSQVGLGSVQNYTVATQAEAEAGTSSNKYMTPLRTKQAIDKFKPTKLSELENDIGAVSEAVRTARFTIGTSTSGWTEKDCDYLCDGTNDQEEIIQALNDLPATGGEVVILDGTYNITASINIPKGNVSIMGSGNATILKRMYNSTDTNSGPTAKGLITLNEKSGCKIQGLQIDGNKATYTSSYNYGIYLYSSSNNTITGNTCTNNNNGIRCDSSSNENTVTGNTCNSNSNGIRFDSSSDNTVTGNTCNNNSSNGVYLSSSSNSIVTGNTCNNNYYGIFLYSSSDNTVAGNTCNNSNNGIRLYLSSNNNTITGNTCNSDSNGIYLYSSSSNNTVTGNTCIRGIGTPEDYTTNQHTILLSGTGNNYNLISSNNCMGKAPVVEGGTGNTVFNNKWNESSDFEDLRADVVAHKADYVRQAGYAVTGGTSTAYTATLDPAPDDIVEGFSITIVPHVDCGASPTLDINGTGAIALRNNDGDPLEAGDLLAGIPYNFRKVGANFTASSGRGVKINGADEVQAYFGDTIGKHEPVKLVLGDTFTKLPDPSSLPIGMGYGVSFSPDSNYMAVAHYSSPYITIYKRSGDTFTKLPDPSSLPTGTGRGVSFSPDGNYMAVAYNSSPYITIYKRDGDTFTKLPNPSSLPTGTGHGVSFSPDSSYMAVSHYSSPRITIYKRNGDTFTKLPDPSSLPTATGYGVSFSPDGNYMAVAYYNSPYIIIYKRSGDTFTKLPDPSSLPTGTGYGVSFSPDSNYVAVVHYDSPRITIYKRSGDTFTKLPDPSSLPTGTGRGVSFSPDGNYMAVAYSASPYITIYKTLQTAIPTGNSFSALSDAVALGYAKEAGIFGEIKTVIRIWRD